MAEQEELRLVVTLDDQASAQLGNLRVQLQQMSEGVARAGQNMGGKAREAGKGVKELEGGLLSIVAKGTFLGNMLTSATKQIGELGASIIARTTDMEGLTREMLTMSNAARTLGTNTAQLRNNLQSFREAGVPLEQAKKAIEGITESFVDLQTYGSRVRQTLMTSNFLPVDQMRSWTDQMQRATDPDQLAKIIRQNAAAIREWNTARYGAAVGAAREQEYLGVLKAQGIELTKQAHEASAFQKQLEADRAVASAAFTKTAAETSEHYERIGRAGGFIVEHILTATGAANAWKSVTGKIADDFERIENSLRTANDLADKAAARPGFFGSLNPFNSANVARENAVAPALKNYPGATPENMAIPGGVPQMFSGGGLPALGPYSATTGGLGGFLAGSPESTNIEDRRATDDNTTSTSELTAEVKRLNDTLVFTQMGGLAPGLGGGMAKALGIDSIGGGGATRYPGGGSGPGIGSAGGDTGGAATHGGGAGGGAAGTSGGGNYDPMAGGDPNLTGNEFLKSQRARFAQELEANPAVKQKLAALVAKENPGAGTAVVESLMNRMSYTGGSINRGIHSGFYGPINRGEVRWTGSAQQQAMMRHVDEALAGSNIIRGATDQGSGRDPNVQWQGGRMVINGEVFNDWGGGPGGHGGAARFREQQQARVAGTASAPIYNAPGGTGGGQMGPGGGVAQNQGSAGIRRGGLQNTLLDQLRFAGSQTGLNASVVSGGQRMPGAPGATGSHRHDEGGAADLKLTDARTGRILDMNNPQDAARMEAFTTAAVRAGATGVGAGQGYMGASTIHVGGGTPASWGGASWIERARQAGLRGGQMTPAQLRQALAQQQQPQLAGAPGGAQGATPVTLIGVAPEASRVMADANARIANTAASATAAAVRAGASPEVAAAAGAAAAQAAGGVMDKPAGGLPTGHRPEQEAQTEEARLRGNIARLEEEQRRADTRSTARTRGVGGEAAPIGGGTPEAVPLPRTDPRTGKVMPRTPGVGGEASPIGGAAPTTPEGRAALRRLRRGETANERRARELAENQKRLGEVEAQNEKARQDRITEDAKRDESPAERLERLQEEGTQRTRAAEDPEGEIDRQLGRKPRERDPTTGFSASGKAMDASGKALDAASNAVKVQSDGTLTVNVKATKGSEVAAKGSGGFKKTVVNRSNQMEPAESGSKHDADEE